MSRIIGVVLQEVHNTVGLIRKKKHFDAHWRKVSCGVSVGADDEGIG